MKVLKAVADFTAQTPWGALDVAEIEGASVKVHWTDAPYVWHVNDGREVFMVLAGEVDMRVRHGGEEQTLRLRAGDVFVAEAGDEHVAEPIGPVRVLVVEKIGSV